MDALYLYKRTSEEEFELRYSLRSLEAHAPYIRKVWIFGDKPHFISDQVEHVSHTQLAGLFHLKTPVTNFFWLLFLSSLIPGLDSEYLRFSDDFFLLKDFPIEEARKDRYLEDLKAFGGRRKEGAWANQLWATHDALVRKGYATILNFETHAPAYMTRQRVMDAYCDMRGMLSEDRYIGLMGNTAILNHAPRNIAPLGDTRVGFWLKQPAYEEVKQACENKSFLNIDDLALGDGIKQFLTEKIPQPSKFEMDNI